VTQLSGEVDSPKILAFLCNWCSYAGADLAGVSRISMPPYVRNIRVMCSSRVDPLWIVKGYLGGADGILIAGCHPSDCHYQRGNFYARRRFVLLKSIFDSLGLEGDRLRLSWISASEGIKYAQVVTDFSTCIRSKGSNTAGIEVFL
jgi:F420-non-reducing hydrogenase iron-sulfur subunit